MGLGFEIGFRASELDIGIRLREQFLGSGFRINFRDRVLGSVIMIKVWDRFSSFRFAGRLPDRLNSLSSDAQLSTQVYTYDLPTSPVPIWKFKILLISSYWAQFR